MNNEKLAEAIVDAVLLHLRDRRPFKYDLPDMEYKHPDLWDEMIESMKSDVLDLISPPPTTIEPEKFQRLLKAWSESTCCISSVHQIIDHHTARRVVRLGKAAVPLLLQDLQRNRSFAFVLLGEIVGHDCVIVPPKDCGRIDAMVDLWLRWGRESGHLKNEDAEP